MVKKLISCGIAATLAASLWGAIPPARRKVVEQITSVKHLYVEAMTWSEGE